MLLDIKKNGDVVSLKMSSGEELIGMYVEEDNANYTIDRPVTLTVGPKGGPALTPYLMTVSPDRTRNLKINKNLVVTVASTDTQLADQYSSALSGIQVAPKGMVFN
jgi:hypothetical protein